MNGWLGAHFLPFYSPNDQKKSKLKKKLKKNAWRYHHFTQVYQKNVGRMDR